MQSISAHASESERVTVCYTKVPPSFPPGSQGSLWQDPHTKAPPVPAVPLGDSPSPAPLGGAGAALRSWAPRGCPELHKDTHLVALPTQGTPAGPGSKGDPPNPAQITKVP